MLRVTIVFALALGCIPAQAILAQSSECILTVERGWAAYGRNDMTAAAREFGRCPTDPGAQTGLAYVSLRRNELARAKQRFETVLTRNPDLIDALTGRGIVAWREADHATARRVFARVLELQPDHTEAQQYLDRLPQVAARVQRPPVSFPDSVAYSARVNGDHLEVRTASGWAPFYVKGMNLGAALPGKHPSEFPDSATYALWLEQMRGMGVNAVRVYTIHPPHFYAALAAHNAAHPDSALWLVHGVWMELPPRHDFENAQWKRAFHDEMKRVVDLLHGRADIDQRPGHAYGNYLADVSDWVLAYVIGRELEPFAVDTFNLKHRARTSYDGAYLRVARGTPMDVWLAEACDSMIAHEMRTYREQRPIAYTNWPTTDPLRHPSESTVAQEVAIRRALGERDIVRPLEYDNDLVSLDPELVEPTSAFMAGWFASYHAYPYYPDFMIHEPGRYPGYLADLKRHHARMPVLISEYGVPASIGIAHLQPDGLHHGGHTEQQMADANARLTREIADAGMAGGMLFAWIDEWFKKNWIAIEFEEPSERNRLWLNRLDAEQHYGVIAMEPQPPTSWTQLYNLPTMKLHAAHDAAYFRLRAELPDTGTIEIGFDVLDPRAGETQWPGGGTIPVGIEFLLRATRDTVRLLADARYNPFRIVPVAQGVADAPPMIYALPGFMHGRFEMRHNRPFATAPNADGAFTPLIVLPNRRRILPDSTDIAAYGYDRGVLPLGPLPDGLAEWSADGRSLEVRIPWMLLNVTDPSSRRVVQDPRGRTQGQFGTTVVEGIGIVARVPQASVQYYRWDGWEAPLWRARTRVVYDVMRRTFGSLQPPAVH